MNSNHDANNILANVQMGEPSRPLPEQCQVMNPPYIPRPISFMSIIHQWQPMGIRVTMDLPFVSDDASTIFCIRNGPFIPDWREEVKSSTWRAPGESPGPSSNPASIGLWAFSAMNAVVTTTSSMNLNFPDNYGVKIAYYDAPPLLSQISKCFRRWRGDMQYRIRIVAGFVTQGYILVAPLKNSPKLVSQADTMGAFSYIGGTDSTSYRPFMQNSYIMSDTSMYRHIEVTYPYEYPTPWYDQYQWIANRISVDVATTDVSDPWTSFVYPNAFSEPFSDNWLCVLLRGALEPTKDTSQLTFELEYRAAENFQFADPGLTPYSFHYTKSQVQGNWKPPVAYPIHTLIVPNPTFETNGVNVIRRIPEGSRALRTEALKKKKQQSLIDRISVPVVPSGMARDDNPRTNMRRPNPNRRNRDADVDVAPDGSNLGPRTVEDESQDDLDPAHQQPEEVDDRERRSRIRRDLEFSY